MGFMGVANSLDHFILMEDEQLLRFKRVSPRILVEMEMEDGPMKELEVFWEKGSFFQTFHQTL